MDKDTKGLLFLSIFMDNRTAIKGLFLNDTAADLLAVTIYISCCQNMKFLCDIFKNTLYIIFILARMSRNGEEIEGKYFVG